VVSLSPTIIALLAVAIGLYARAVRVLARRGYEVTLGQQAAFYGAMSLTAIGLLGPPGALSGDLMVAHMAEHLLIADLAAPLFLIGLRTPVLVFVLPRPVLVPLAHQRRLRAVFRTLRRPLPSMAIYVFVLYAWHMSFAFEAALRNPVVHALQHESFVIASVLLWWSVVEPNKRRTRGELWKIGQIVGCRIAGMFLGMAFIIARTPLYGGFYGDRARSHGLDPLFDQQLAGGMMLGLDLLVMFMTLAFFFYRSGQDADRAEARERAAADADAERAPATA
jgi:putative membrane protein